MGRIVNIITTGDPHEDFTSLENIVTEAIKLKADILCPGDYIDGRDGRVRMQGTVDGDVYAELLKILSKRGIDIKQYLQIPKIQQMYNSGQFKELPEDDQEQLIKMAQGIMKQVNERVPQEDMRRLKEFGAKRAEQSYEHFARIFQPAAEAGVGIYTLGGNHDWVKVMREKMGKVVRFGDVEGLIKSKNGIKYAMTHNTKEIPGWFAYDPIMNGLFLDECVDFVLGHDIPKDHQSYIAEANRLGNAFEEADIIMYHKATGDPRDELVGGSFARDTKPKGKPILGGHMHRTYVGTDADGNPLIAAGRSDRYIRTQFDTGTKRYVGKIEIWEVPSRYNSRKEAEIVPINKSEKAKKAA